MSITAGFFGFILGFAGSVPPAGPIGLFVLSTAVGRRYRLAVAIAAGAALAEGAYAGAAYWGLSRLLHAHPLVLPVAQGLAAIALLAVGARFSRWRESPATDAPAPVSRSKGLALGFSISALNPMLVANWGTVCAGLLSARVLEFEAADAIPFGAGAAAGILGWFVLLVIGLRRWGGRIPAHAFRFVVRTIGVVLLVLGALLVIRTAALVAG